MNIEEYKLNGYKPSPIDERDYNLKQLVRCAIKLPECYRNSAHIQILDQGNTSMCVGCALAQAKYIIEQSQTNDSNMFSPAYIYANRKESDWQGEGMIPRQALKGLKDNGVCHLHDYVGFYDYQQAKNIYTKRKDELDKKAYPYRISSYYRLNNINDIKEAIYTTGFALVAYDVYKSLYQPVNGDVIYEPNDTENLGGHQMIAIGYDDNRNGGSLIVVNSWGKEYGNRGICYIPYDYKPTEAWAMVDSITEQYIEDNYNNKPTKVTIFTKIIDFIKSIFERLKRK